MLAASEEVFWPSPFSDFIQFQEAEQKKTQAQNSFRRLNVTSLLAARAAFYCSAFNRGVVVGEEERRRGKDSQKEKGEEG